MASNILKPLGPVTIQPVVNDYCAYMYIQLRHKHNVLGIYFQQYLSHTHTHTHTPPPQKKKRKKERKKKKWLSTEKTAELGLEYPPLAHLQF